MAEDKVLIPLQSLLIPGRQCGTATGFSPIILVYPCQLSFHGPS